MIRSWLVILLAWTGIGFAADLNDPRVQARLARGEIVVDLNREPGSHAVAGTAMGVVNATREQVWAALGDFDHFPDFLPLVKECYPLRSEVLDRIGATSDLRKQASVIQSFRIDSVAADTFLFYEHLRFPIPVGDRRCILRRVENSAEFRSRYTMVRGDMKVNDGSWELRPYAERTLVIYTTRTDPGVKLPGFLITIGERHILPEVIKGVRRHVKEMFSPETNFNRSKSK